jgi:nucleotide-binding universal stress UspA family protein
MQPVMLALSTFRQSDELVQAAITFAAAETRPLLALFVVDVNLARYFIGVDLPVGTRLRERCEEEVLAEYRQQADAAVARIADQASSHGVACENIVLTGRFGVETVRVAGECNPIRIFLTRSKRPQWVRHFFGSPVDHVIGHAGCPVSEIGNARVGT